MTSHRPRGIALAALSGVASMSAGVAVAQLVAVAVAPASSPVVAVGRAFIDATPTWLKEFAIERFGTADKAVLLTGIGLVLVVAAGADVLVAGSAVFRGSQYKITIDALRPRGKPGPAALARA